MIRAAVVGTGFVARVHAWALRALEVDVVAVCGRTRVGAEAFAVGRPYDDLEELLEEERPDVVHVCTPNHLHAAQALVALERGVHVVCEKPLAVSTAQSARLVEAAAERGLVGATCYHVRGYPLVAHMRAEVAAGTLGRVRAAHGRYLCDDVLFPASGWRVDPSRSGPSYVVADLGTHWLDAAEHVTSLRVAEVLAEFRAFAGGSLEDFASLLLRFESGAVGSLVLSAGAAGRKNQLVLEVEGARGGLTWDQEEPNTMLLRLAGEASRLVRKDPAAQPRARYPAGHAEGYGGAFRSLFADVYAAVRREPHGPFPTLADGHRGVALVEASVASAREAAGLRCPPRHAATARPADSVAQRSAARTRSRSG